MSDRKQTLLSLKKSATNAVSQLDEMAAMRTTIDEKIDTTETQLLALYLARGRVDQFIADTTALLTAAADLVAPRERRDETVLA